MVFPSLVEFPTISCDLHFQSSGMDNKVEVDIFLKLSCFFDKPTYVGYLISDSSAFSKFSLNIWKLTVHTLLKPGLEKAHILFSMFLNFLKVLFNIMIYSTKICMTVGIKIYIYIYIYICMYIYGCVLLLMGFIDIDKHSIFQNSCSRVYWNFI